MGFDNNCIRTVMQSWCQNMVGDWNWEDNGRRQIPLKNKIFCSKLGVLRGSVDMVNSFFGLNFQMILLSIFLKKSGKQKISSLKVVVGRWCKNVCASISFVGCLFDFGAPLYLDKFWVTADPPITFAKMNFDAENVLHHCQELLNEIVLYKGIIPCAVHSNSKVLNYLQLQNTPKATMCGHFTGPSKQNAHPFKRSHPFKSN